METLTADQFKQKYGGIAQTQFDTGQKDNNIFSEIKDAFNQGASKVYQGVNQALQPGQAAGNMPLGLLKAGAGGVEAAFSPLAPVMNRTVAPAINYAADKISDIPAVQEFAQTKAGEYAAKGVEGLANVSEIAGAIAGAKGGGSATAEAPGVLSRAAESIPKPLEGGVGQAIFDTGAAVRSRLPSAAQDILPTSQGWINHSLTRALDLTPGDLNKISASTGNDVGGWVAKNNLIGTNKATTVGLIKNFFKDNYDQVRSEINKVDLLYKPTKIPRFTETLKTIAAETQGKLGLEGINKEIQGLLNKKEVTLADVQRVKELLDEHFSLYKVTGDVSSGVAKQGLANVRSELKSFIEKQVADNTGADIRQMNNNVATAKSLADAIETRSPRGLTRAQLTWRDAAIGMGLTYFGSPLAGLGAVAVWKILTSPTARLRLARWLDNKSDAYKAQVSEQFKTGNLSPEVKEVIGPMNESD